jgi:predicted permease
MHTLWQDLRYAVRSLRRHTVLSVIVLATLTLGVGLNTAVFTLINADTLRTHVEKDPDSFLRVHAAYTKDPAHPGYPGKVTLEDYLALGDKARSCDLAAFAQFDAQLGQGDPAMVRALLVSNNFFSVYNLERPLLGRLLQPGDYSAASPVVVLSEELWRNRFGADTQIVGKVVHFNDQPLTIIGVTPTPFAGRISHANAWLPYPLQPFVQPDQDLLKPSDADWLTVVGRVKPGFTHRDAAAELELIATQQDRLHPGRRTAITVTDGSWFQEPERHELALWVIPLIIGTLTLVTLVACANVITLLLSRATARQQEIAVRLALGAGRMRLVRMLLSETLLLAFASGLASLYLVYQLPPVLYRFINAQTADFPLDPDWRVFWYLSAVTLLAGVLSGLTPALMSLKFDVSEALKGRQALFGRNHGKDRVRGLLIGAQVAMSFVLLVGAGLFLRTYQQVAKLDPGFESRQVLASLMLTKGQGSARRSWSAFHRTLAQHVGALPGVQSVAFAKALPFAVRETIEVQSSNRPVREVATNEVSPEFFSTCGIPIVLGRTLEKTDSAVGDGASQVVVSQELVRQFWGRENPLGKTLRTRDGDLLEVVGVARDTSAQRIGAPDSPLIYQPWSPDARPYIPLVRFVGDPGALSRAVTASFVEMAPGASIATGTIQSYMDEPLGPLWTLEILIGILGAIALALSVIGIYGVVSFAVSRRTKELGIRIALGAQKGDIFRSVLGYGARPIVVGLLTGLLLALAVSPVLARVFQVARSSFTVNARDPLAYAGVAVLLAIVALAGTLGPARRAAKVDPLVALREE